MSLLMYNGGFRGQHAYKKRHNMCKLTMGAFARQETLLRIRFYGNHDSLALPAQESGIPVQGIGELKVSVPNRLSRAVRVVHCIHTPANYPRNQHRDKLASMWWSTRIQTGSQKLSSPRLSNTKVVARSLARWCSGTGAIYLAHIRSVIYIV